MSTIVKNIHIFKDGAWHPIKKVFKDSSWRTMKGIFHEGVWYEIGVTCVVMPDGCAVNTGVHPRWDENTNHYGTNNFKFNALPGGFNGIGFNGIGFSGYWWSATEYSTDRAWGPLIWGYGYSGVYRFDYGKEIGFSVRCVKDYTGIQPNGTILSNDYTDGDGNKYDAVVIGEQLWTVKNLQTTKYQNGANIPNVTNNSAWRTLTTGAYCWYNNDYETYGQYYGALYNWYAVNSGLVNNNGYRVPSDSDWTQLTDYLIDTNWCNDVIVSSNNVAQFLKSCRQVNHPLAPSMTISPSSFNLNKYYNRVYFTITSNYTSYTIETLRTWITLETVSGSGNTTVYFSVSNNAGVPPFQTPSRIGSILIKSNGTTIKTIDVTQDGGAQ